MLSLVVAIRYSSGMPLYWQGIRDCLGFYRQQECNPLFEQSPSSQMPATVDVINSAVAVESNVLISVLHHKVGRCAG